MKPSIIIHINYFEQGQTLEEACQKAVQLGFDGMEFRNYRSAVQETMDQYLGQIASAVTKFKLKEVIFGGPKIDVMKEDAGARQKEVEYALKFYEMACDRFPLKLCNTMTGHLMNPDASLPYWECERHGSFIATEKHWDWAAESFRPLAALAEKKGFRFAFETHMNFLHDLPASALKLVEKIGSKAVGINFDYGNAVFFKQPPKLRDSLNLVRSHLYYIHLKNSIKTSTQDRVATLLSDGEINHREYLKWVKESGYNGPICVEAPRPGDREHFARQDVAYLKQLVEEIW